MKGEREKQFAQEVLALIVESDMHPLMAFAALMEAIAIALKDIHIDSEVILVQKLADDIYKSAIVS